MIGPRPERTSAACVIWDRRRARSPSPTSVSTRPVGTVAAAGRRGSCWSCTLLIALTPLAGAATRLMTLGATPPPRHARAGTKKASTVLRVGDRDAGPYCTRPIPRNAGSTACLTRHAYRNDHKPMRALRWAPGDSTRGPSLRATPGPVSRPCVLPLRDPSSLQTPWPAQVDGACGRPFPDQRPE